MNWLVWLSLGIILVIAELFIPGFFIMGFGVSACITAIPAALGGRLVLQLVVYAFSLALFFLLVRPLVSRIPSEGKKSGMEALMGKEGMALEDISSLSGRVKVDGETWNARSAEEIGKGSAVIVEKSEGVTLSVRRK